MISSDGGNRIEIFGQCNFRREGASTYRHVNPVDRKRGGLIINVPGDCYGGAIEQGIWCWRSNSNHWRCCVQSYLDARCGRVPQLIVGSGSDGVDALFEGYGGRK